MEVGSTWRCRVSAGASQAGGAAALPAAVPLRPLLAALGLAGGFPGDGLGLRGRHIPKDGAVPEDLSPANSQGCCQSAESSSEYGIDHSATGRCLCWEHGGPGLRHGWRIALEPGAHADAGIGAIVRLLKHLYGVLPLLGGAGACTGTGSSAVTSRHGAPMASPDTDRKS